MAAVIVVLLVLCGFLMGRLCLIQRERAKAEQEINDRLTGIHDEWDFK